MAKIKKIIVYSGSNGDFEKVDVHYEDGTEKSINNKEDHNAVYNIIKEFGEQEKKDHHQDYVDFLNDTSKIEYVVFKKDEVKEPLKEENDTDIVVPTQRHHVPKVIKIVGIGTIVVASVLGATELAKLVKNNKYNNKPAVIQTVTPKVTVKPTQRVTPRITPRPTQRVTLLNNNNSSSNDVGEPSYIISGVYNITLAKYEREILDKIANGEKFSRDDLDRISNICFSGITELDYFINGHRNSGVVKPNIPLEELFNERSADYTAIRYFWGKRNQFFDATSLKNNRDVVLQNVKNFMNMLTDFIYCGSNIPGTNIYYSDLTNQGRYVIFTLENAFLTINMDYTRNINGVEMNRQQLGEEGLLLLNDTIDEILRRSSNLSYPSADLLRQYTDGTYDNVDKMNKSMRS